jgi:hypothetical protein
MRPFAEPDPYEALEEGDVNCAIRLPAYDHLQWNITGLLSRGTAEPQAGALVQELLYQAATGKQARHVVANVEFYYGNLFLCSEFVS